MFNRQGVYRKQTAILILSTLVIWGTGNLYFVTPSGMDLSPVGYAVSGVLITVGIFREGLLDVVPVARDSLVEKIEIGVLVVDKDDKVVDINPMTRKMFHLQDQKVIGKKVTDILTDYPRIKQVYEEIAPLDSDSEHVFSVSDAEGETRHYKTQISPLFDNTNNRVGHTFVINDITDQKKRQVKLEQRKEELERQKRKLEHQNERLDDFASIVSHDLRNPLNVAEGYVTALQQDLEGEEIEIVQESIDRMGNIIDDSLALARQGKAITETEDVEIANVARNAWQNVDTAEAELVCETDELVTEADEGRLLNLFENLFRNAVEHGGDDVTVRVGRTPNGFYVEDDGKGISDKDRDSVLEQGYTTSDEGTGFGLSIVKTVAEAHGWDIEVGESEEGGARFEISGISTYPTVNGQQA